MEEHSAEHSAFEVDKRLICFKNKTVKCRDTREIDWGAHGEYAIACLEALWAEGLSLAEIGRRMGISSNAVVGKVDRLKKERPGTFKERPSPIRRDLVNATKVANKPKNTQTMTKRMLEIRAEARKENLLLKAVAAAPVVTAEPRKPAAGALTGTQPATTRRVIKCCWPIGEPRKPGFRFCEAEIEKPRKSYCAVHAAMAYPKPRDRREDAA